MESGSSASGLRGNLRFARLSEGIDLCRGDESPFFPPNVPPKPPPLCFGDAREGTVVT